MAGVGRGCRMVETVPVTQIAKSARRAAISSPPMLGLAICPTFPRGPTCMIPNML